MERYYYSLMDIADAYSRQHKFPFSANISVDEFIRQAVLGYIDILEYINFKEIQGPFPKEENDLFAVLPTHTVFYNEKRERYRFYFFTELDSIIIERLVIKKNNSAHIIYLTIIKTLSKIIRGKCPDINQHPILKGEGAEGKLRHTLEKNYYGLSDKNLQKIFAAANANRQTDVSDETLLVCIAVMLQIIFGEYCNEKPHPSVSSKDDLINKLYTLEPSLKETDLGRILAEAEHARNHNKNL